MKIYISHENTDEEFSWLPTTEPDYVKDLISDFHSAYPDKCRPLSSL